MRIAGSRRLGTLVADILHEAGVPDCKGGVMAKNAPWRGSVATWQHRIDHWIARSDPKDLLSVDIFFDLRAVHGDGGLAVAVRQAAFAAADGQVAFAKLLVEGISIPSEREFSWRHPHRGRPHRSERAGLFGVVSAARAMAIRYHVTDRSTPARLAGVKALAPCQRNGSGRACRSAWRFLDLIVSQQVEDVAHGIPPSNAVSVKRLSTRDRDRLRVALEAVASVDELTRDVLFKD